MATLASAAERPGTLVDRFGRVVTSLRISVTDRCNLRCRYCMPAEGLRWLPRESLLSDAELERLTRLLAGLGVTQVRLTGGEPLVRRDLPDLIARLAAIDGVRDIGLTTNGYFLADDAERLAAAGLQRLNVSLDSLIPATFAAITRRDYLHRIREGLAVASRTRLRPIKINVVLIRGVNDGEIESFGRLARDEGFEVRFIEFMPIGESDGWSREQVVPAHEVRERLSRLAPLAPLAEPSPRPADRYAFADGRGTVGFIASVSAPFCADCDRIRLTADGMLRNCLFALRETDLRTPLRAGADDRTLTRLIRACVADKWAGHQINEADFQRTHRPMAQIGG